MDRFSIRLRELRKDRGITQKDLAQALDFSATCYAGYEQGYREPDLKTLRKLCIYFDVSADYLLGLEDETGAKTYNNYCSICGEKIEN